MTRFASLSRGAAAAVLLGLFALVARGLWVSAHPARPTVANVGQDYALYLNIVQRVRSGEPYEVAAVTEQRRQRSAGFPLRPFFVVRPPLLAHLLAALPDEHSADHLLAVLGVCTFGCWLVKLAREGEPIPNWLACALGLATGLAPMIIRPAAGMFHEAWAGVLIAVSLALRSEKRFAAAVAVGLLAALIREFAMPYLLVMATASAWERRGAEALGFATALFASLIALAAHAHLVLSLTTARDLASPGWMWHRRLGVRAVDGAMEHHRDPRGRMDGGGARSPGRHRRRRPQGGDRIAAGGLDHRLFARLPGDRAAGKRLLGAGHLAVDGTVHGVRCRRPG
jgi:hypothetical protein